MISSASSARSANRDEARVKLLALEWNERQIAGFGIEMRDPRPLRPKAATNSASGRPTPSWTCACTSSPAWSATRSTGEYTELMVTIRDLMDILARESRVLAIIKEEVLAIKAKYATPRLTQIVPDAGEINMEDLIANEGEIITITHGGFIKRTPASEYRSQTARRQGRHRHDHARRRGRR